jgi:hypothetical protein
MFRLDSPRKETRVPVGYESLLVLWLVKIPGLLLDSRTGGPHSQFERCGEEKSLSLPGLGLLFLG